MAVIKSGASTDQLTIGATSKAARVVLYDELGNLRGPKPTYRAAVTAAFVAAASAQPFFLIYGSASKTIIVQRITVYGPQLTAVAYADFTVRKYSTTPSVAGTPVALTQTPVDSNSAAATASLCSVYTGAPTAGTLIGTIGAQRTLMQATTAVATSIHAYPIEFDFRTLGSENTGIYLRTTSQGLGVGFAAAPASAVTMTLDVEWTEE